MPAHDLEEFTRRRAELRRRADNPWGRFHRGLAPQQRGAWEALGSRLVLTGALLVGLMAGAVRLIFSFLMLLGPLRNRDLSDTIAVLLGAAPGALIYAGLGSLLGLVWTGMSVLVVWAIAAATLRLTRWDPPRDALGMGVGALVGLQATWPVWAATAIHDGTWNGGRPLLAVVLSIVTGIAIAGLQSAGLLAGVRDLRRRTRGRLHRTDVRITLAGLLMAMALTSLALSLARWIGAANLWVATGLAVAFASAAATAPLLCWAVNRWADRRVRGRRDARLAERST